MGYIREIGVYLPENKLTNEDINKDHPEWSVEKISKKTGIFERSISSPNEFASDLGYKAALNLFNKGVDKNEIDYLIFCTQSPDYLIPTTACILQERLGLSNDIAAIDINMGCSGYLYGLSLAEGIIASNQAENVLLITAETYTKLINPNDKSNKTIFGDGATATLITNNTDGNKVGEIGKFSFYTDGRGYDKLIVKNGGIKYKEIQGEDVLNEEGVYIKNDDYLYMDGKAVFEFTAFKVPPAINKILEKNNCDLESVDLFIFHQANAFMMDFMRKKCKIPKNKFHVYIERQGNTVSSTVPLALNDAISHGLVKKGSKILLIGFGVGLSISGTIIDF